MEATAAKPPPWLGLGSSTSTRPSASYRVTTDCLGPTGLSSCTGVMMLPRSCCCNASSFLAFVVAFVHCSRWPVAHLSLSRTLESPFLRPHSIRLRSRPHPLQMLLARTSLFEVGPVTTPGSVSPASVVEPTTAPFPPAPLILDLPPASTSGATSPQSASSDGSESPVSDPEFPSATPVASAPAASLFLYNHRSNVVHAAVMCEHIFLKTVTAQRDGRSIHCKPVCGAKTMHLLSDAVVSAPPPGAQPCLRSACIHALGHT